MYFIRQLSDESERQQRINRLRTMMNFCEQSQCRWSRILQYFGEQPAAPQCGHCDQCLDEQPDLDAGPSPRTVDPEDPPEPPGQDEPRPLTAEEDRLYEALRQERTRLAREAETSAYIVASNRELADIARRRPRTIAELIEIKGIRHRKAARFGQELLDVVAQHSQDPPAAADDTAEEMQLALETPPESWQQRFNALAEWRTLTSANDNCDPSDLLTFPAMRHLAEHPPATIEALSSIEGVGSLATDRYADELSAILGIHAAQPEPPTPEPVNRSDPVPSWQTTLDLYQAGHTILAIAERRMLSPGTISTHLVTALRNGHDVDLRPALPPTDVIQSVRRLLGADPDASVAALQERFDYRLSNAEMHLVVAHLRPPEVVNH